MDSKSSKIKDRALSFCRSSPSPPRSDLADPEYFPSSEDEDFQDKRKRTREKTPEGAERPPPKRADTKEISDDEKDLQVCTLINWCSK